MVATKRLVVIAHALACIAAPGSALAADPGVLLGGNALLSPDAGGPAPENPPLLQYSPQISLAMTSAGSAFRLFGGVDAGAYVWVWVSN